MKKYLILLLTACVFMLHGAEIKNQEKVRREKKLALSLAKYPDTVVSFANHKLTKKDVVALILKHHPDFEEYSFDELMDAVKRVIDEKIYYTLLSDFLTEKGFPPSQKSASKFLQDSLKKFPPELRRKKYKNSTINTLAADPDLQLTIALQSYLKKNKPDQINVSDEDVEFFYRVNQTVFVHDAKVDIAFIAVDKKETDALKLINQAHSLLLQGVKFDRLAKEINAKLPPDFFGTDGIPPEMVQKAAELPHNEPSAVLDMPEYYAIVKVTAKQEAKYIPLKNAAFFIRSELESRKSGLYLERLLGELLSAANIRFHNLSD